MDDFFSAPASSSDPTSDFLAREQAALGTSFDGSSSHAAASGEYDFEASASAFPDLDGEGASGPDDLGSGMPSFGSPPLATKAAASSNGAHHVSVTGDNEFAAFENDYPKVEMDPTPAAPSQQQQYNGFGGAPIFQQQPSIFPNAGAPQEEESQFLKDWKVKQSEEIARREEVSKAKKEDTILKARNAIDNFYQEYNAKKEKNIAKNKEEEATFNADREDALGKGTTWDRICTLVDLQDSRSKTSTKSKQDLARFKEILLALKREGDSAPGAAGY